jgi:hypothetical protein
VAYDPQITLDAVVFRLESSEDLSSAQYKIEQGAPDNKDPDRCPLIGVWLEPGEHTPHVISAGNQPWKVEHGVRILIQNVSYESGEAAQRRVLDGFSKVMAAFDADLQLASKDGTKNVRLLGPFTWTPNYEEGNTDSEQSIYFVSIEIILTVEARA